MEYIGKIILILTYGLLSLLPLYLIYRWSKLLYYMVRGQKVKGTISGLERSKYLKNSKRKIYKYYVHYIYYDDENNIQKGRLDRVYHESRFTPRKDIGVRYLKDNPKKSIAVHFYEYFTYELLIFIATVILLIQKFN